jgi:hypothetical protein
MTFNVFAAIALGVLAVKFICVTIVEKELWLSLLKNLKIKGLINNFYGYVEENTQA